MIEFQKAKEIAAQFAALGEPTRMLVLYQLLDGPSHVGRLADIVGIPIVNMSHHLGVMRTAGILEDNKKGRQVVYGLRPDVFTRGGAPDALATLTLGTYKLVLLKPKVEAKEEQPAPKKPARKLARRAVK